VDLRQKKQRRGGLRWCLERPRVEHPTYPPPRSTLGLLAPAEQTEERDNQKIRKQKMKKESYKKTQRWGRGRAGPWLKTFEGVDAEFGDVVARGRGPTLPSQSGKRRGREIENRSEG